MAKNMKKEIKLIQTAVLVAVAVLYFGLRIFAPVRGTVANTSRAVFYVQRVVDGDTIKLSDGQRVRLIGVDTPELHYSNKLVKDAQRSGVDMAAIQELGQKASDFTKSLVDGKSVRLEYDITKKDKYGRTLAYIYLEDGTFVNAKILEDGFGQIMTIPPNVKYADYFLKLQREARKNGKGLWSTGTFESLR